MSIKYALDTNIIVRYIVQDDEVQAKAATEIIENADTSFISSIVMCEVNWVLKSAYKIDKDMRANIINKIISISSFEIENHDQVIRALKMYKAGKADFSDYLIQQIASKNGYSELVTFDKNTLNSNGFITPNDINSCN